MKVAGHEEREREREGLGGKERERDRERGCEGERMRWARQRNFGFLPC